MDFYQILVKKIVRQTKDCVQLILDAGSHHTKFKRFIPGQYLSFEHEIEGELIRRSYSICSSPKEESLSVAIKEIPHGRFSTYANNELKAGDTLMASLPQGNFVPQKLSLNGKNILCIAVGSGITPILSIIKSQLENSPEAKCILLYGNKSSKSIIFKNELDSIKNLFLDRLQVFHLFTREQQFSNLLNGRISKEKLKNLTEEIIDITMIDHSFICGPEEMILASKEYLETKMDKENIHFELFFADSSAVQQKVTLKKSEQEKTLEIVHMGKTHTIELGEEFTNVLEEASAQGLDLPFACKGGVCCTCKAKIDEGTAKMFVNYALEPEEVEAGYVLTCQCYPTSDKLVINYDKAL